MKTWITSIDGAIALSVIALLSFIGYAFLESRYFLRDWTPSVSAAAVQMLVLLALVGGWLWALFAAVGGSRRGLVIALVFSAVIAIVMLYDLVLYSPVQYGWPLVQIMLWVTFLASAAAITALAYQLYWGSG